MVLIAALMGLSAVAIDAAEPAPIARAVGQRMANFSLKDTEGTPVTLYGFRGKRAVVLAFTGIDCPIGNLYAPRLVELNKAYSDRGVVFLAINSNAHEGVEQVAEHARSHGIDFPVLKDPGNLVADLALVERTCEVVVLDGRADGPLSGGDRRPVHPGGTQGRPRASVPARALDAILAGEQVKTPATMVAGCLLDRAAPKALAGEASSRRAARGSGRRPPRSSPPWRRTGPRSRSRSAAVTYAADVARIVQEKCQSCHRPGQVGPFSLRTYDDARRHAANIREVVDDRRMPPWHADPRYGRFRNDRSLSARERATLLAWVDQGTPLGDPARPSRPPRSSRTGGRSAPPTPSSRSPSPTPSPPRGSCPTST